MIKGKLKIKVVSSAMFPENNLIPKDNTIDGWILIVMGMTAVSERRTAVQFRRKLEKQS